MEMHAHSNIPQVSRETLFFKEQNSVRFPYGNGTVHPWHCFANYFRLVCLISCNKTTLDTVSKKKSLVVLILSSGKSGQVPNPREGHAPRGVLKFLGPR